jgi:hypothetical protein
MLAKAKTVVVRVTKPGRSALIAVMQASRAIVSGLCRAGTALSLQRECNTGNALTLALFLRQRELCADSCVGWHLVWRGLTGGLEVHRNRNSC